MTNAKIDAIAATILQRVQDMYGPPLTRLRVDESAFPHLDLRAYRRLRADLEAQGFVFLGDLAVAQVNDNPTTLLARTMVRGLRSADGAVVATYYQVRPRWGRLFAAMARGLRNRRWVGAASVFVRMCRTRHNVEFASELSDGRFLTTSNAVSADKIGAPPELERHFRAPGTPWRVLQAEHAARMAEALSRDGARVVPCWTADELLARYERENEIKRAHRARVGWITRDELRAMASFDDATTDAIHARIRARVAAGSASLRGETAQSVVRHGDGAAAND